MLQPQSSRLHLPLLSISPAENVYSSHTPEQRPENFRHRLDGVLKKLTHMVSSWRQQVRIFLKKINRSSRKGTPGPDYGMNFTLSGRTEDVRQITDDLIF